MTKLTLIVAFLAVVSTGLGLAGLLPPLVPQSLIAFTLGLALLSVVNQSGGKSL